MNQLMRQLAPRSALGFISRLIFLISVVAAANLAFGFLVYGSHEIHSLAYHLAHAAFVGGPLIAFFLAVTVFQIRLQRKLWHLSRKDGLTGLNNRRTFFDLATTARTLENDGVLLMLDADWFKKINDTHGHNAGDQCLKSIARTLQRSIRQGDIVGRIGGEEFAVYLQNATFEHARAIGNRLTRPITFHPSDEQALSVTLSVGAVKSCPKATLDELFAMADNALYRAKLNGRAQLVFSDGSLEDCRSVDDSAAIPVSM
jgi:diguanylate cyclase (GGDEF)-like protein